MDNRTTFIRVEKDENYSVIHNQFLRREDLSWKAKGILAYILMLPNDWNISLKEIMRHATEGEKAFRSGWKELKDAGYVKRYPVRDKGTKKIAYWETVVRENVDMKTNEPLTQNLHVGKVDVGKVDVGNGKLQSTDITKYLDKQSTDNKEQSSSDDLSLSERFEKIWQEYPNKKSKKKAFSSYKSAIKQGTTDQEILEGLNNYKKHLKQNPWKNPAHGSTWFNQNRWEDEYQESAEQSNESEPNTSWKNKINAMMGGS